MIKKCEICGTEFEAHTYNQKYCSRACYKEANRRRTRERAPKPKKQPLESRTCEFCGKRFVPHSPEQRYCSNKCSVEVSRLHAMESFRRRRVRFNGDAVDACAKKHLSCFKCPYKDCMYD